MVHNVERVLETSKSGDLYSYTHEIFGLSSATHELGHLRVHIFEP